MGFWESLGEVAKTAASTAVNTYTKKDETAEEIAYLIQNGQAYPVNGVVTTTAKATTAPAANVGTSATGTGFALTPAWMIGIGAAVLVVLVLVFSLTGRRKN